MLKRTTYVLGSRVICVTLYEFSKMPTVKPSGQGFSPYGHSGRSPGPGFCHSISLGFLPYCDALTVPLCGTQHLPSS